MPFGNRLTSVTNDKLLPKLVDTILNGNVLATRLLAGAKKWRGGSKLKQPIKVAKNNTTTSFSGYDILPTNGSDTRVQLEFEPKFSQITVSLPLDELSVNQSDEDAIIDLATIEIASAAQDFSDDIGTMLFGDGTGNSGKDFLGLGAIIDDGSVAATIGGQSRATYTGLQSTVIVSGGTLTLAKMSTLYNSVTSGLQKPTLGITTEAVWSLYEQLLQPQERIAKDVPMMKGGTVGGTGFTGLFYKGFPILSDEKSTSGALFFINEDYLDFYALPMAMTKPVNYSFASIDGTQTSQVKGLGFSWSDWILPANAAAIVGHIYLGGQLVSFNPRRHGKLTGITGI